MGAEHLIVELEVAESPLVWLMTYHCSDLLHALWSNGVFIICFDVTCLRSLTLAYIFFSEWSGIPQKERI